MDRFLTSNQVADFLGIREQSLRKMRIDDDGPPYLKFRHYIRYSSGALNDWIASNTLRHTAEEKSS